MTGSYGTTQQPIIIQPGQRYSISVWARGQNLASSGAVSVIVDDDWRVRPIVLPGGSFDWTQFRGEFSLPSKTAQVRVLSEDRGEVWLDDIHITLLADEVAATDVASPRQVSNSQVRELAGSLSGWPATRNATPHGTWFACPRLELTLDEPQGEYRALHGLCTGNSAAEPKAGTVISFRSDLTTRDHEGVRRLKVADNTIRVDMYGTVHVDQQLNGRVVSTTHYPAAWLTLEGTLNPTTGIAEGQYSLVVSSIDARDPPERTSGTLALETPSVFDGIWKANLRH
ncbi:MAG: hypothetical protein HYV60_09285 [Planctomycetia bacterium]|nr:hypothetical protein [Planctomycetia bacterium]